MIINMRRGEMHMSHKFNDFLEEQLQDPEFETEYCFHCSQGTQLFRRLLMQGRNPDER
jgi:hypothetical protein